MKNPTGSASVSISVALLLPGVGSVTPPPTVAVAVLLRVPVAEGEIRQVAAYVAEPPAGRLAVSLMLPDPLAVQVPPPAPVQAAARPRHLLSRALRAERWRLARGATLPYAVAIAIGGLVSFP